MIDVLGPFLLIIFFDGANNGEGVTAVEVISEKACRAAVIQLEPLGHEVQAVCIAAQTVEDRQ